MTAPLILASASPRRRMLLGRLGVAFDVQHSHVDEHVDEQMAVTALAQHLALRKAQAVAGSHMTGTVLGADTIVAIADEILGKPRDADDAVRMLRLLRGRHHTVATGIAVVDIDAGQDDVDVAVTMVTMRPYSDAEIAAYVASGEPLDKAGAYAIQGGGRALVAELEGRFDTVVGLPLDLVARMLGLAGA